jgi:hypothetical protein
MIEMEKPDQRAQPPAARPHRADAIPRLSDADVVWQAFENALACALLLLEEEEFLIIESQRHPHYVQFARAGDGRMRLEAVSNAFIADPAERLSEAQHARIAALGWDGPAENAPRAEAPPGFCVQGNFYINVAATVPTADVSALACATLRHGYGVTDPGELEYYAFHRSGDALLFPTLRLRRHVSAPRNTA